MSGEWTEGGPSPYQILGLGDDGPNATPDAIKKVFRKLAVVKHPDKNPNNPNAAAEFGLIDKAYRILLDPTARAALDDWIRARAARHDRDKHTSDKRREMRDKLEAREKRAAGDKNEEEVAKTRLRVELERLRKRADEEQRKARQEAASAAASLAMAAAMRAAEPAAATLDSSYPILPDPSISSDDSHLYRSLKVSWDPALKDYSSHQLRAVFQQHGHVEDVVMRERKKSRKATALVVMDSEQHAMSATTYVCGDVSAPLLVTPLLKLAPASVSNCDATLLPDPLEQQQREKRSAREGAEAVVPSFSRHPSFPLGQPLSVPSTSGLPLFPSSHRPPAPTAAPLFASSAQPCFPGQSAPGGRPHGSGFAPGASSFPSGFSSFPGAQGGASARGAGGGGGFEATVLGKMKREADRKRALQVAEAEDAEE